jgi:hypothetical protein
MQTEIFIKKSALKYAYRNSAKGNEISIALDDYGFTLCHHGHEQVISYASIVAVRIARLANNDYRLFLYPDDSPTVTISSLSRALDGQQIDQSREYTLFVRVLHHHLKDKSSAVFTSGGNAAKVWTIAAISAVSSLLLSVIADYLGFELWNPYLQAAVIASCAFFVAFAFSIRNLPKNYTPTDIPLQFLP